MDPITAAIGGFNPANILLAGAAVITLVISIVGIKKIRDIISVEAAVDAYLENGRLYRDLNEERTADGYRETLNDDGEWERTLTREALEEMEEYDRDQADRWGVSYEGYAAGPQDGEDWEEFIARVQAEDSFRESVEEYNHDEADRWGVSYEGYVAGPQDGEDWEDFIARVQAEDAALGRA